MQFFKHFTDAHEGKSLLALFDKFGHAGPYCYWILVELCAKKLNKSREETFSETDFKFIFNERLIRDKFRLSSTKVESWLNLGSTLKLFNHIKVENEIHIDMPKLLECLDRDTKRARPARVQAASKPRLRIELDKELELELDKDPPKPPKLIELWNEHCGGLPKVLKTNKSRNARISKRESEAPVDEWIEVIKRIASSNFCQGKNSKHWKADFDWLLQPEVRLKVLEGKYDNRLNQDPFEALDKLERA